MSKVKDKALSLRPSVEDLFNTVDDLLEGGKLTKNDQEWLEKELEVMEKKLRDYKRKHERKTKVA
jgi:hypothetical protein